ncbi:MAG: RNA polymerase sigma-70 factor [Cytophagaceae bacterium]
MSNLETLYKENYQLLINISVAIVKDEEVAEDIVQDVFFKLWEKKMFSIKTESPKGYLIKSVANSSLNYIRSRKVRDKYATHYIMNSPVAEKDFQLEEKELELKIKAAIESLPVKCKIIFMMSRFEDMKYKEIAEHLGISIKTVENQMSIALDRLKKSLKEYF